MKPTTAYEGVYREEPLSFQPLPIIGSSKNEEPHNERDGDKIDCDKAQRVNGKDCLPPMAMLMGPRVHGSFEDRQAKHVDPVNKK